METLGNGSDIFWDRVSSDASIPVIRTKATAKNGIAVKNEERYAISPVERKVRRDIEQEHEPEISLIEKELYNSLSETNGAIRDMCIHFLKAGGKRIRPLLTVYWGQVFNGSDQRFLKVAVATELIHMASLIHDDIIDNSDMRRNKPSIHTVWGSHHAVLCGDYLFARAFEILSCNKLFECLEYLVGAIQSMCSGEVEQASFRFNTELSIKQYYSLIAQKTGILLGCCCKSGAAVGGATELQLRLAYNYGLNLGYAFQIVDDVLDYFGETKLMGKPRYEDITQGGITLPLIFMLKDSKYGFEVREMIKKRDFSEENLNRLASMMLNAGIKEKCMCIAAVHIEKAKKYGALFSDTKAGRKLVGLAEKLKTRTF